jgi:GT2 family glycosyltransferase
MRQKPKVSLVIVSRDRPRALRRVLMSLRFQHYMNFEVIVVSNIRDPGALNGVYGIEEIRLVFFDDPNISKARNIGINNAAGDIIAFCDDDAVPEPPWLERLVLPFETENVGAAGGYVRGRNGISFQWKANLVDCFGDDTEIEVPLTSRYQVFEFADTRAAKVQGTNCAFRRAVLCQIGGFDENFAFFLDETDLVWRLTRAGWQVAIVPLAEVQHGFEQSDLRSRSRVPRSLFAVGASKAYFLKRHASGGDTSATLSRLRVDQKKRLLRHMISGWLEPGDVGGLMATLEAGLLLGTKTKPCKTTILKEEPAVQFARFPNSAPRGAQSGLALGGNLFCWPRMRDAAKLAVEQGREVTVFRFTLTALFHSSFFHDLGFWVQRGGLFGKSGRDDPYFRICSARQRVQREAERISSQRKIVEQHIFRNLRIER